MFQGEQFLNFYEFKKIMGKRYPQDTPILNSVFFNITLLILFVFLGLILADRNRITEGSQPQAAEFPTTVQGKQIQIELSFLVNILICRDC